MHHSLLTHSLTALLTLVHRQSRTEMAAELAVVVLTWLRLGLGLGSELGLRSGPGAGLGLGLGLGLGVESGCLPDTRGTPSASTGRRAGCSTSAHRGSRGRPK